MELRVLWCGVNVSFLKGASQCLMTKGREGRLADDIGFSSLSELKGKVLLA